MNTLIAFDPGGTTGWCRFQQIPGNKLWDVMEFGQFPVERLESVAELIQPQDIVVYEQIQVLHLGFDPIGLQVIGAIKLWCALGGQKYKGQSPGILTGAKTWPDLKEPSKWFTRQQHAKDAFYHGVTYIGLKNVNLSKKPSGHL